MTEKKETKKEKILKLLTEGKSDEDILKEVEIKNPRYLQVIKKGSNNIEAE